MRGRSLRNGFRISRLCENSKTEKTQQNREKVSFSFSFGENPYLLPPSSSFVPSKNKKFNVSPTPTPPENKRVGFFHIRCASPHMSVLFFFKVRNFFFSIETDEK